MKRVMSTFLALTLLLSALPAARALTVYGYSEGLAQCEEAGLWGFATPDGAAVIPPQYNSVVSFALGMAAVNLGGKLGVIRPDGQYLIPPEYDTLMPIGYGLYMAQRGSDWGVVSILPYTGADGKETREVYPITHAGVDVEPRGGVTALVLHAKGGGETVVPLFRLPTLLADLGVEGSRFPLTRGKLPQFSDVKPQDWYDLWVDLSYNTGIMEGKPGNLFDPTGTITVAEVLQMAANMDSRYRGDDFHTNEHTSTPWYTDAVNYCTARGIIAPNQFDDYTRVIARWELAQVFAATALAQSLPQRNDPERVRSAVRDITPDSPAAQAIYALYTKGILTGVDSRLTFRPDTSVTRAEAAALGARLARPEQRIDLFPDGG